MAITQTASGFVNSTAASINLSRMFTTTPGSSDPTYLVLTALDRNEYTAGASGATGSFSGNGHVLNLSSLGGDGRGAGIVFTYQASTGRYYNSTYGYLDQLTFNASGSLDDVTSLSLFGTDSLGMAEEYASDVYTLMQADASGYIGSATVATEQSFSGTVPAQATPDSVAAIADSFVGRAWNMNGCWVLASTIAAEAGASLPVQSTVIGVPGQASGEWIVAYNGPAGQSGNWQAMVTVGEIIVIGTSDGGGHITTCVSGSGSSALLVDNITYVNSYGQIVNLADDGSANDVTISAPHAASQEWAGVQASSVVIYELDTPVVTDSVGSDVLSAGNAQSLGSLFAATDPGGKAIAAWQIYDTDSADSLVLGGKHSADHSAASALTAGSLSAVSLLAGSGAGTDNVEVRAFNGSYWGDWTSLAVTITTAQPPVVRSPTAPQIWAAGRPFTLTLPASTFADPKNERLTYKATLSGGAALPGWLSFNAATETFSGTAPAADGSLNIAITATDTSGLSASETISVSIVTAPRLTAATPSQTWGAGQAISLALPGGTFTDPQGEKLTYKATLANGQALPGWLVFNAATGMFTGTAPAAAQSLSIRVTATDSSGLSASETFSATVIGPPVLKEQTPAQVWAEGKAVSLALPRGTFTDPQGESLTYKATLSNGNALPSWLKFNAATETFSGTAPVTAQTLGITVTATNASGFSTSESFTAAVHPATAKGMIASVDPGDVVPLSAILTGSPQPAMGFLAGNFTASNATYGQVVSAPADSSDGPVLAAGGLMDLAALPADTWQMAAADLFTIQAAAVFSQTQYTPEARIFAASTHFDPSLIQGLMAFHT